MRQREDFVAAVASQRKLWRIVDEDSGGPGPSGTMESVDKRVMDLIIMIPGAGGRTASVW